MRSLAGNEKSDIPCCQTLLRPVLSPGKWGNATGNVAVAVIAVPVCWTMLLASSCQGCERAGPRTEVLLLCHFCFSDMCLKLGVIQEIQL